MDGGGSMTETIIVAIIGSGALSTVIQLIASAISARKGLKSKIRKIEKDTVRLQLLFLIHNTPDAEQEILQAAQYYFETLKANWYMSSVFDRWLKSRNLKRPIWFTTGGEKE